MNFSSELTKLAEYLTGEFSNQQQALEQPAWYVNLCLWQRKVDLFTEDSLTIFAEQANIININKPYRPRILRLREKDTIEVEYYMFKDINKFLGSGMNPERLVNMTAEDIKFLPNCTLQVTTTTLNNGNYKFTTSPLTNTPCSFDYQGNNYQVFIGFEATKYELKTYDKGIDPKTGKAIWGALMGAYEFSKISS